MENPYDLSGKVALVTGGSRGLGREMVLAFAKACAHVAIVSRKVQACEALAEEIQRTTGQEAFACGAHVGKWQEVEAMVEAVYARFGKIDVLVNNAGMSPLYDKVENVTEALYDKVLDVNLKGPFRLMAMVGSRMTQGDGGSIINISSVAAINPSPSTIPYGAAMYFASQASSFTTGATLRVDGGDKGT